MEQKTLYLRSHGQPVRALQLLLKKYEQGLAVDGIFGPRTERAVRAAQRKLAVFPADGIAGPHTLSALAKAAKGAQPANLLLRPAPPPQRPSFDAQLGAIAHKAGAAVASAAYINQRQGMTVLQRFLLIALVGSVALGGAAMAADKSQATYDQYMPVVSSTLRDAHATFDGSPILDARAHGTCVAVIKTPKGSTLVQWKDMGNLAPHTHGDKTLYDIHSPDRLHTIIARTKRREDYVATVLGLLDENCLLNPIKW